MQHFRFHKEDAINVNKVYLFRIYQWIFTYTESKSKNLRMLFCQLIISALTCQKDLLDFGKVFIDFIPSSETPESR